MSASQILSLAFAAIAVLAVVVIGSVAYRRGDRRTRQRAKATLGRSIARRRRPRRDRRTAAATRRGAATGPRGRGPGTARRSPETPARGGREEYDITRRQFFNRGIAAIFGIFLAQFGIAALAFMWPKLRPAASADASSPATSTRSPSLFLPDGRVQPLFVSAAQSYIVPFQADVTGTSFEGLPVVAGGLMALWQRCVHLGCRVPECQSSPGFECPCHGSKYNYHGEYEDGPAPRNLDRFVVP
jgi:cytochrome b6-f complex iron-sulfur subunit